MRTNLVELENNENILADSQNNLDNQKNYVRQLLNVHAVDDVNQTEIH